MPRVGRVDRQPAQGQEQREQQREAGDQDRTFAEPGDQPADQGRPRRVGEDLHSAELFSLPITLALMLLAFGALIAAGGGRIAVDGIRRLVTTEHHGDAVRVGNRIHDQHVDRLRWRESDLRGNDVANGGPGRDADDSCESRVNFP